MTDPFKTWLKPYLQYQKPQAKVLLAASLPLLGAIYNFGWRSLLMTLVCALACWAGEYAFTRREGKPASLACLVTAMLLSLSLPANVPFWMAAVGSLFAIIVGKMVFGGFGKNIFNPAVTGRCFLYICFPGFVAASWYVPFQGFPGGLAQYAPAETARTKTVDESAYALDSVTSATALQGLKRLTQDARRALASGDIQTYQATLAARRSSPRLRVFYVSFVSGRRPSPWRRSG